MRIYYLLLALLLLCLTPVPGDAGIITRVQKYFCRARKGRCAALTCLPREEQIGTCSVGGRKCCRRRT